MRNILIAGIFILLTTGNAYAQEGTDLTVHEWGTITTEHAANGWPKGYLNVIRPEEVLPEFVYRLDKKSLRVKKFGKVTQEQSKAIDKGGHPDVIMRLETPVMYFYPAESFDYSQQVNVSVSFKGGLLNEYYPNGAAAFSNLNIDQDDNTGLDKDTLGGLHWSVTLSEKGSGPPTDSRIWLAPREVMASYVNTADGESEKYIFYRGVAKLNALLKTIFDKETRELTFANQLDPDVFKDKELIVPQMWLVSINADGQAAFRNLGGVTLSEPAAQVATTTLNFDDGDHSAVRLDLLKQEMHAALVQDGLFPDEATAMLNTWDQAYFKNAGVRVFYMVPREWTDHYLPLHFWTPVQLERAIIGRIDLDLN